MSSLVVAIVGMPNAGKTTLFNRLIRYSDEKSDFFPAITDSMPGVTRDRNIGTAKIKDREIDFIDTGGFMPDSPELKDRDINKQVREQAIIAIQEADLIIHLIDSRQGLNPSVIEMSNLLRTSNKSYITVANKVDSPEREKAILEFYELGVDMIIPISAMTGYNINALLDIILKMAPITISSETKKEELPKIAVIGRPNTGKSTLINSLLTKDRLIVSPTPGTTRDAIDTIVKFYQKRYLFIDTAGIRKRSKTSNIEHYAIVRAEKAIKRADIAILLIDGTMGVVDQDQKIAGLLKDAGKGTIILVNKWDLIENPESAFKRIEKEVRDKLWFLDYAPIVTVSGMTKKRISNIFPLIDSILLEMKKRIPTSELNAILEGNQGILKQIEDTSRGLRILYMTQVSVAPPHFVLFVNKITSFKKQHIRFFQRIIRDKYGFLGSPINISIKSTKTKG
ncbi:MAG: ribosome biogenesis GTPase Der [Thermodesulfovibrionales bacterium]|nr:ribosome biogenesis GTPase Der [Thermodesulfovibrionales bacterium]